MPFDFGVNTQSSLKYVFLKVQILTAGFSKTNKLITFEALKHQFDCTALHVTHLFYIFPALT